MSILLACSDRAESSAVAQRLSAVAYGYSRGKFCEAIASRYQNLLN
ncbi:MAG: hypothetical protein AAFP20_09145 [Cyanobacteria bacterium J06614_10]